MDNPVNKPASPGTTRIIATPKVWLEGEAVQQLENTAAFDDCAVAVGMPDLHPGPGYPIGAAFGFTKTIRPHLVGSDAGCGAIVVALADTKFGSNVERRLRAEFERDPLADVDRELLCRAVWNRGPLGLLNQGLPAVVETIAETLASDEACPSGAEPSLSYGAALGTIGGGNHFAEIGRVTKVVAPPLAEELGLHQQGLVLLCHSGSRGLGKALADKWGHEVLEQDQAGDYLADLAGAVRFARANRILLAWRLMRALGVTRPSKIRHAFDVVHNSVDLEAAGPRKLWVHRKGCAPAHEGQPTAVLGSRGAPSWVMSGKGNSEGLSSVAHGAGRKMKRSEAREKIRSRYRRKGLTKSAIGSTVICDDKKLLYEEHPDAYKPIEPIIDSLEKAALADRVAAIEPLLTVKK